MGDSPGWEGTLLWLGATVIAALLTRAVLGRARLPSVLGYLLLGFALRLADQGWGLFSANSYDAFQFLAKLGLFALLFNVGLKSNLGGLLSQLRRAAGVWTGDVLASGGLGFLAAFFVLGLGPIPSSVVAVALTATSVGVSVAVWQSAGALDSPDGQLLTDVAELDDMTGIALMALLFSLLPAIHAGSDHSLWPLVGSTVGLVLLKLTAVIAACAAFSRYFERRVTRTLFHSLDLPGPMVCVAGIGLLIAGLAAVLGLSLAIGAFLAGLAFSRDPKEHELEASFEGLYEFLSPFFFVGIGLNVDPGVALGALGYGLPLLAVAIAGKWIGVFFTAWITTPATGALLLGLSMIPRAEIALVIMQRGRELGNWAVPPEAFAAMVVVSAGTCALAPLALFPLLRRWKRVNQS
jgi:Kef-type K+ transport system membrane component KefB